MRLREICLDLDDVLNTLAPRVLNAMGYPISPTDYTLYPREHGFGIESLVNEYFGRAYTRETFWAAVPERVWYDVSETAFCQWLVNKTAAMVGRENVFIATATVDARGCLEGKRRWMREHLPLWLQRQYAMTTEKWRLARPGVLLIDDYDENIRRWRERGGVAIQVPRPWNALRDCDPWQYLRETFSEFTPFSHANVDSTLEAPEIHDARR